MSDIVSDPKVDLWSRTLTFQKNCVICFIENPLEMMKNAFYFIKVNFKAYDVTPWLTNDCDRHCPISHEVKASKQWKLVDY